MSETDIDLDLHFDELEVFLNETLAASMEDERFRQIAPVWDQVLSEVAGFVDLMKASLHAMRGERDEAIKENVEIKTALEEPHQTDNKLVRGVIDHLVEWLQEVMYSDIMDYSFDLQIDHLAGEIQGLTGCTSDEARNLAMRLDYGDIEDPDAVRFLTALAKKVGRAR
jgi:hypothetical protein